MITISCEFIILLVEEYKTFYNEKVAQHWIEQEADLDGANYAKQWTEYRKQQLPTNNSRDGANKILEGEVGERTGNRQPNGTNDSYRISEREDNRGTNTSNNREVSESQQLSIDFEQADKVFYVVNKKCWYLIFCNILS